MTGKLSLNLATIYPASLEAKLHAAETAGFRAVGLLTSEMLRAGEGGLTELTLSQLAVSELVGVSGWADSDRAARLVATGQAERAFDLAAAAYSAVVVAAAPREAVDPMYCADRFRELCRLAAARKVRVGLECSGGAETVHDLAVAWEIVEASGAANGGLVIDVFHYYKGGSTVEMLEPVPGERIFLVQLCDCMDMPKYEMENRHRVYPGEGAIPLEPLLGALHEKGYRGYFSLELYNEQYWAEDPVVVARDAMRALHRL